MNRFLAYLSTIKSELPFTDLTSNQFIDGMRKIYELEPFIKLNMEESMSQKSSVQLEVCPF